MENNNCIDGGDKIYVDTLKDGKWEKIELKRNIQNPDILDDSNDIIKNDEFVGEICQNNNYILNEKRQNKDNNIIKLIDRGQNLNKDNNYNNNCYILENQDNIINSSPSKRYEYGKVIEERRNYKFYVSGVGYVDDDTKEDISNRICVEKHIKNSPSVEFYKLYNDNHTNTCSNINIVKENKEYTSNNSSFRNSPNYICYSSPNKTHYKSPYNLESKGIMKDNLNGQYFRVFKAVPIDIDINDCEEVNYKYDNINNFNKLYSPNKYYIDNNNCNYNNYNNRYYNKSRNNNFFFISSNTNNRSQEKYFIQRPIFNNTNYNTSNLNLYETTNIKSYIPTVRNCYKSFHYKKQSISPTYRTKNYIINRNNINNNRNFSNDDNSNCRNNKFISKKMEFLRQPKNIYNNNYIQVNEIRDRNNKKKS